jgi:hypothetical protein
MIFSVGAGPLLTAVAFLAHTASRALSGLPVSYRRSNHLTRAGWTRTSMR